MRIAMWSVPRSLSTAMMYAFGNRPDFHVVDEPFYGPYLRRTWLPHPMSYEIRRDRVRTAKEVARSLSGPIPDGKAHALHKHMCPHMIRGIPREFMKDCTHVFLIHDPARVISSFAKGLETPTEHDLGYEAQAELFDHVVKLGLQPHVICMGDILEDPEGRLTDLCDAIGLDFRPDMISWPSGGHPEEGIWASYWYEDAHRWTGFPDPEGAVPALEGRNADLCRKVMPHYEKLLERAM